MRTSLGRVSHGVARRCVVQLQVSQRSNTIPINSDYKRPKSRVVEVAPSILCQSLFFEDGQSGNLTASVAGLEKHDITSADGFGWPSLILFATGHTNSAFNPSNLGQGKIKHQLVRLAPTNPFPPKRNTMNYRNSHPFCFYVRKISCPICPVTGSVLLIMAPKAKHSAMLSCTGGVGSQWRLMATT